MSQEQAQIGRRIQRRPHLFRQSPQYPKPGGGLLPLVGDQRAAQFDEDQVFAHASLSSTAARSQAR